MAVFQEPTLAHTAAMVLSDAVRIVRSEHPLLIKRVSQRKVEIGEPFGAERLLYFPFRLAHRLKRRLIENGRYVLPVAYSIKHCCLADFALHNPDINRLAFKVHRYANRHQTGNSLSQGQRRVNDRPLLNERCKIPATGNYVCRSCQIT